jgi:hypothetical protein
MSGNVVSALFARRSRQLSAVFIWIIAMRQVQFVACCVTTATWRLVA